MKSKLLLTTAIVGMTMMSAANAQVSNSIIGSLNTGGVDYDLAPQNITAHNITVTNSAITLNNVNIDVRDTQNQFFTLGSAFNTREYFTNNVTNFRIGEDNIVEYSADGTTWNDVELGVTPPNIDTIVNGSGVTLENLAGSAPVNSGEVTFTVANITTNGNSSLTANTLNLTGGSGVKNWINVDSGTFTLSTVDSTTGNITEITSAGAGLSIELAHGTTLDVRDTFFDADTGAYDGVILAVGHNTTVITNLRNTFAGIDMTAAAQASGGKPVGAKIIPTFGRNDVAPTAGDAFQLEDAALADWVNVSNDLLDLTDNGDGSFTITDVKTLDDVVRGAGVASSAAPAGSFWNGVNVIPASGATEAEVARAVLLNGIADDLFTEAQVSGRSYSGMLESLNPVASPMLQSLSTEKLDMLYGAIKTRLANAPMKKASGEVAGERGAVWAQGLYSFAEQDDTSVSHGFETDTYGFAIGGEMNVNKEVKVGLTYGYTYSEVDGHSRTTDVDDSTFALYGEYARSDFYVNGFISYGMGSYEEERSSAGVGITADYDADTFGFQGAVGKGFAVSGATITPEVGVRYINISPDAYTDSLGMTVSPDSIHAFTTSLNVSASKDFKAGSMTLTPEANLGISYDMFSDESNAIVTVASVPGSYTVKGEALGEFAFNFGLGLSAEVMENLSVSVNYEGQVRSDYMDHAGMLKAKYNF